MDNYGLDLHASMLLDEYREQLPVYGRLREVVMEQLKGMLKQSGIEVTSLDSRIKTEKSFVGKLQRKASKYHALTDITDIIGVRIVAYYNEDVDRIASMAENLFEVDWANSVDKRKMHQFDSFGYNSLHYICRMPKELFCDPAEPSLNEIRFELQMRTALQHVWSDIQHDIGYKSEIETPMVYHRDLSRLAGLLELADNEFSRIRRDIADYRRRAQSLVQTGHLDEVMLDGDTFRSYLQTRPFDRLNERIAAITQAELQEVPMMPYLLVLRNIGLSTLGDVERMIAEDTEDAYQLALYQLGATDIDILSSTVGLQNLCIVAILKSGGGKIGLQHMFDAVNGVSAQNADLAEIVFKQAARLSFMA
jgi:ppGpp synthetase/RelA/SpoT-type nucleotidyltranferase